MHDDVLVLKEEEEQGYREEHATLDRVGIVASQLDLSSLVGGEEGEGPVLEHVVVRIVFDPGIRESKEEGEREGRRRG